MFDAIAGNYDFLNHLLSAGIDKRWRRRAIRSLRLTGQRTGARPLHRHGGPGHCRARRHARSRPSRRRRLRRRHAPCRAGEDARSRPDHACHARPRGRCPDSGRQRVGGRGDRRVRHSQRAEHGRRMRRDLPRARSRRSAGCARVRHSRPPQVCEPPTSGTSTRCSRASASSSRSTTPRTGICRRRSAHLHRPDEFVTILRKSGFSRDSGRPTHLRHRLSIYGPAAIDPVLHPTAVFPRRGTAILPVTY